MNIEESKKEKRRCEMCGLTKNSDSIATTSVGNYCKDCCELIILELKDVVDMMEGYR